jgi:hypothetical protein
MATKIGSLIRRSHDGWEFRMAKPACARCGRHLKDPDEVLVGIHDTCREKWGIGEYDA